MGKSKMVEVVALRRGLYLGAVYEAGDRFTVPESLFSAKKDAEGNAVAPGWFVLATDEPAAEETFTVKKGK